MSTFCDKTIRLASKWFILVQKRQKTRICPFQVRTIHNPFWWPIVPDTSTRVLDDTEFVYRPTIFTFQLCEQRSVSRNINITYLHARKWHIPVSGALTVHYWQNWKMSIPPMLLPWNLYGRSSCSKKNTIILEKLRLLWIHDVKFGTISWKIDILPITS